MNRRVAVFGLALALALSSHATAAGVYEGQIDGDYHGWDGETIYKLRDGHIIQQAAYHYHYHYAYAPAVIIYQARSGQLMIHVEGDSDQDVAITVLK